MSGKILLIGFGIFLAFAPFTLYSQHSQPEQASSFLVGTVKEVTHPDSYETHILLEGKGQVQEVCLGDFRLLDENGLSPRVGDSVEVKGFTDGGADGPLFIAISMKNGDRTLTLRDASGRTKGPTARRGWYGCCHRSHNHDGDHYRDRGHHGDGHYDDDCW